MGEQGTGHRQRLKDRFTAGDAAALTDVALLELLLTFAIPRADVRPLAEALVARFDSLDRVLSAPAPALHEVKGLGDAAITLLKLTRHLTCATAPTKVEHVGVGDRVPSGHEPGSNVSSSRQASGSPPAKAAVRAEAKPSAEVPGPAHLLSAPGRGSAATPGRPADPDPAEPAPTRWRASGRYVAANMLKSGLVPEITLALHTYGRLGDLAATRIYLQDEGLPQRSRASRATVVNVFRDRIVTWNPPSWVLHDLMRAADETGSPDLRLLLLLHTARQDVLLYEIVQRLIVPRWRQGVTGIEHNDVQAFLDQASPAHPEIADWARDTRTKLAGNVLTVLRDYGLLAGKFPKRIVEPVVTVAATRHLARLLIEEGVPEKQCWLHPDWALWLLEPERARGLLQTLPEQKGSCP